MNNWYLDFVAEERRREEERSFAQSYRLASKISGVSWLGHLWQVAARVYGRGLVILGSWMVTLGCRLQTRYELTVAPSLPEGESASCS